MSVKIMSVDKDSPGEQAGILSDETLISINGNEINDILDYRFYETCENLTVILKNENNSKIII